MLIIFEGIDRVGKSTLAQAVADRLPTARLMHYSPQLTARPAQSGALELERLKAMYDVTRSINEHLVVDRFHLSELVYGRSRRGYDAAELVWAFDDIMTANDDVMLVYVRPTNLEWSSAQHGADLTDDLAEFDAMFKRSRIKRKLSVTFDDIDIIHGKIEARLTNAAKQKWV